MRGRTFKNSFIIADEVQNSTPTQLLMVATRIGKDSKLVITGDLNQSDLLVENGLQHFVNRIQTMEFNDIKMVKFNNDDVERSQVVKNVIKLLS